jgi:hypothetical protein
MRVTCEKHSKHMFLMRCEGLGVEVLDAGHVREQRSSADE